MPKSETVSILITPLTESNPLGLDCLTSALMVSYSLIFGQDLT